MALHRSWQTYQPTYCAEQVKRLAGWVALGVKGIGELDDPQLDLPDRTTN